MNRSTPGLPVHHQLGVHWDSRPSSQWCNPAISSSVVPFSSCPQSLPASESFPMSQLFTWGGQSTGVATLASFLPKKSQGWSPSEWTGWISLQSKGLSRVFSNSKTLLIPVYKRCHIKRKHKLFPESLRNNVSLQSRFLWGSNIAHKVILFRHQHTPSFIFTLFKIIF